MDEPRIITIGITGASCSGKTTLSKSLLRILPNCDGIQIDDFARDEEEIPLNPIQNLQDWDVPQSIKWGELYQTLMDAKKTGKVTVHHRFSDVSHGPKTDELNQDFERKTKERLAKEWRRDYQFIIVEGFLLLGDIDLESSVIWNDSKVESNVHSFVNSQSNSKDSWRLKISEQLDFKIFVRGKRETLRNRRENRRNYSTSAGFWEDPPHYFDKIVWPAYKRIHAPLFEGGDVENGKVNRKEEGLQSLMVLSSENGEMVSMIENAIHSIESFVSNRRR